jgi:hypothetical protein
MVEVTLRDESDLIPGVDHRRRTVAGGIGLCVIKCAMHYHHYTMSRQMAEQHGLVNTL